MKNNLDCEPPVPTVMVDVKSLMNIAKSILPYDVVSCIMGQKEDSSKAYNVEANIIGFDYTYVMNGVAVPGTMISYHN